MYIYMRERGTHIYIHIYIERERERETPGPCRPCAGGRECRLDVTPGEGEILKSQYLATSHRNFLLTQATIIAIGNSETSRVRAQLPHKLSAQRSLT